MSRGLFVVLWVLLGVLSVFLGVVYLKRAVKMASEKDVVEVEVPVPVPVFVDRVQLKKEDSLEHVRQPVAA